jgi:hypothetical protein
MESWKESSIRRKLEQARDPERPLRRGVLKGRRPKGRKARMDELQQAKKEFFKDFEWYEEAKARHAEFAKQYGARTRYLRFSPWPDLNMCREDLEQSRKHYFELLAGCERDGLI